MLKELFTTTTDGKTSASHLWFHIGNTAAVLIYILVGIRVADLIIIKPELATTNIEALVWFTFVIVAVITGNKLANTIANYKLN